MKGATFHARNLRVYEPPRDGLAVIVNPARKRRGRTDRALVLFDRESLLAAVTSGVRATGTRGRLLDLCQAVTLAALEKGDAPVVLAAEALRHLELMEEEFHWRVDRKRPEELVDLILAVAADASSFESAVAALRAATAA